MEGAAGGGKGLDRPPGQALEAGQTVTNARNAQWPKTAEPAIATPTQRPSSQRGRRSGFGTGDRRRRPESWGRRLPLLPGLLYVVVVTQVPFLFTVYYSFQHWILTVPYNRHFAGFANYRELFSNPLFLGALRVTVELTVLTVAIAAIVGLLLALLLDRKFIGRSVVRTLVITPFLIVPAASGQVWKNLMLDPTFGLANWLLEPFGIHHVAWTSAYPLGSVVAVQVWEWTPFMTLIMLAGLQAQPEDVNEAARVDGASSWSIFWELTLPSLRPYIELGVLLGAIYVVTDFAIVDTLTAGGPGTATQNIPYYLFSLITNGGNVGQASAIGVVTVAITLIVATVTLRLIANVFRLEPAKS